MVGLKFERWHVSPFRARATTSSVTHAPTAPSLWAGSLSVLLPMTRSSASDVTPRGEVKIVTTSGIQKNLILELTNIQWNLSWGWVRAGPLLFCGNKSKTEYQIIPDCQNVIFPLTKVKSCSKLLFPTVSTTHGEVWSSTDFRLLEWDCSIASSYVSLTWYHDSPVAPVQRTAINIYILLKIPMDSVQYILLRIPTKSFNIFF